MAFELSTVVYTNADYGLRVVKDDVFTKFKDIDNDTFTVPTDVMNYLISIDENSSDEVYHLTYIINKAFSNYNYAEVGILRQIEDRFDYKDKEVELSAEDYANTMALILDRYKDNIDLLIVFFESLKEYQIVQLFTKYSTDQIIKKLDEVIDETGINFNGNYKDTIDNEDDFDDQDIVNIQNTIKL